ncbi:hypothetical protein [Chryseobacterium sp. G0201]|uniref:hypothetical protein n=1 Tax=Chryseobacterium sp. G0201 TaxID=2487065 RepID=UPI000F4D53D4|nr:hypothetical protein [Chryseobacterium sp. G0201]AZA52059.1 hypothetical protein EG348_03080 [Chryseobacterium sp. G0201]
MLDNLKLSTTDQGIIQRLAKVQGFEKYKHRNNNYIGFCKYGKLMRLDFRKSFENGGLVGFHHLEISISPHYHYNQYHHNGNDLTPDNCIKTVLDILTYLKIEPHEYNILKVVNIEFGLNLTPDIDVKTLVNGLYFYKKTVFMIPESKNKYFKITHATNYKQIKAYAKGLQFSEFPEYGINQDTFRFEVKSKKSANINKYGIKTVSDLLKIETYAILAQKILSEWENVLIINNSPDFSNLKTEEVQFISKSRKVEFWDDLKQEANRNKFARYKEKYYKILKTKNNPHLQIKIQIIDKILNWSSGAYFPQKTIIHRLE